MTRTEFVAELRAIADDIEAGTFHLTNLGENIMFCNKNYGQIYTKLNGSCTISMDLYNATDEEKEAFK